MRELMERIKIWPLFMALSFCTAVWPDDELKSSLNSSQRCPKRSHNSFDLIRDVFPKYSKKSPKVLDYFGQKIVKNNFHNSPNLDTLPQLPILRHANFWNNMIGCSKISNNKNA